MTLSHPTAPRAHRAPVHPGAVLATTTRVLRQLRHDPRTLAMMLLVPALLLGLLYLIWKDLPAVPGQPSLFDRVGLTMSASFRSW